jgi:hypothetical protein
MQSLCDVLSGMVCRTVGSVLDLARRSFPRVVRIETTNACNAHCIICPHDSIRRPIAQMDDALYVRLIDECACSGCREIQLHNFGEPLMDKQIENRISYAKKKGIKKVKFFSNGSLLDERRAKGLIESGLDEIKISIDGACKEEFERIRTPLRFEIVIQNIIRLVSFRNSAGSKLKIHVTCCSTSDKQGTMQLLENVVDKFYFNKIHNWGDIEQTEGPNRVRKPCSRLWNNLTVLADGSVSLCCLDYDGQHLLGHIDAKNSISSIWSNPAYCRVRKYHREGRQNEIILCANCTKSFM